MKILVTGASGFVGQHLCRELLQRGSYEVVAVSRRPVAFGQYLPWSQLTDRSAFGGDHLAKADAVVHLAGLAHVPRGGRGIFIDEFRKTNVDTTIALAKACVSAGVGRFVYLSSIKVNGEETFPGRPFRADDLPRPEDFYGKSKCEAEIALMKIAEETGLCVTIIRPPLVYGPGVKANFLGLIKCVAHGVPLPLSSVRNERSFVAVDNLNDLIIRCLGTDKAINRTFLVSDGSDLSIVSLLRIMGQHLGRPARIYPMPPVLLACAGRLIGQSGAVRRLCGSLQVDITSTRETLGWIPPIAVDEGIRLTTEWYLQETKTSI